MMTSLTRPPPLKCMPHTSSLTSLKPSRKARRVLRRALSALNYMSTLTPLKYNLESSAHDRKLPLEFPPELVELWWMEYVRKTTAELMQPTLERISSLRVFGRPLRAPFEPPHVLKMQGSPLFHSTKADGCVDVLTPSKSW